jgi:hypothetical protein
VPRVGVRWPFRPPAKPVAEERLSRVAQAIAAHDEHRTWRVIDHEAGASTKCVGSQLKTMLPYHQEIGSFSQRKPHKLTLGIPV